MLKRKRVSWLPVIVYICIFVVALIGLTLHAMQGMNISAFWKRGLDVMRIDTSVYNGVSIKSYRCPMFMNEDTGATVQMVLRNKETKKQPAGVTLLVSSVKGTFQQSDTAEKLVVPAKGEATLQWNVDKSNVVDGHVSVRFFLGLSPLHPANSVRSCVIIPVKGAFWAGFLNTWAYPILMIALTASIVWVYLKSGLDWSNKKRFFFFLLANVIVFIMAILIFMKLYMPALIALPFLVIGLIATLQQNPFIPEEDYDKYIDAKP